MDLQKSQPQLTPTRESSPLFEPEDPLKQQKPNVPVAVMVSSTSSLLPAQEPGAPEVSPFIKQLQDIEAWANAEKAGWDPKYLTQTTDSANGASQLSTKRKGKSRAAKYENTTDAVAAAEMDLNTSDEESDDSGSDSDEEEDQVPPHDPDSQIRPKLPIYHPGFQLTEDITQKVLSTFSQFIVSSVRKGYKDAEAQRLREQIIKKKDIKYQDAVRLAVAGDTGVGKSALLNALLGVLNLTIEVC